MARSKLLRWAGVPGVIVAVLITACAGGETSSPPPTATTVAIAGVSTATPGAAATSTPALSPSRTPTPTRTSTRTPSQSTPTPTPRPVTFQFGKLVDPGDRAVIEAGVSQASDYIEELASLKSTGVIAYVYSDLDNVSVQWEGVAKSSGVPAQLLIQGLDRYVAEAFPATIFINTAAPEWRNLSSVEQLRLAAHEYFHTVQMSLVGAVTARAFYSGPIDQVGVIGPNWLLEGSAEYMSWSTLEWLNLGVLDERIASLPPNPQRPQELGPYSSFYGVGQSAYDASLAAVYRLVGDRGPASLIEYFRYLGYGITWPNAFLLAFGRSPEDFYSE